MKLIFSFFLTLVVSSSLFAQIIVEETPAKQTVNYSYDDNGNLVKNFELNEKVNIDSLKQLITGTWVFSKYVSWEKPSHQTTPTILEFKDGNVKQLQGIYGKNTENIIGNYTIKPYKKDGVAISITIQSSSSPTLTKLKLIAAHCQANILFFVIKEYNMENMTYRGLHKFKRQQSL